MSDLEDLRAAIDIARGLVKAQQRSLRGLLQHLSDLDERLEALENAQPERKAQRNEHHSHEITGAAV